MRRLECCNPIVLFDEIDKLPIYQKEVSSSLLEILDPSQNDQCGDTYLNEFKHDYSNIWFMFSMNDDIADSALKDRMEILEVPDYSRNDMIQIIMRHIFPNTCKDIAIKNHQLTIDEGACETILNLLGHQVTEHGLRPVERLLRILLSRVNMLRSMFEAGVSMELTYKLEDFKGFPYHINSDVIHRLYKPTDTNDDISISAQMMFQ